MGLHAHAQKTKKVYTIYMYVCMGVCLCERLLIVCVHDVVIIVDLLIISDLS